MRNNIQVSDMKDLTFNKKRISKIELLAYFILTITFITSLTFPLIFKYVGSYSVPTALFANNMLSSGISVTEVNILASQRYWKDAGEYEKAYPAPSLLLAIFMLVSNFPLSYTMFIPLVGVSNIIYFALAKYVLSSSSNNKSYITLFSALYYALITFSNIHASYIGRAVLGVNLFTYFLFYYLKFLNSDRNKRFSWGILLLLIALVIGYTYYTTTLSIITLLMPMIIISVLISSVRISRKVYIEFGIVIMSILLFIQNIPPQLPRSINATSFFTNFIQYIKYMLGSFGIIPGEHATSFNIDYVKLDLFSLVGQRIFFSLQYFSVLVVLVCLIMYRPKNMREFNKNSVWLFSLIIFLSGLSEFMYFFGGPKGPGRLLMLYGVVVTLFISNRFIDNNKLKPKKKVFIATITILIMSLSCLGTLNIAWNYGWFSSKPYTYDKVLPLTEFLSSYSIPENPVYLAGDDYCLANMLFIISLHNKTNAVILEPLGEDVTTLYEGSVKGEIQDFLIKMDSRNIGYLMLVNDPRPIYGDAWGPRVPSIVSLDNIPVSIIYNDGQSRLYRLPNK